MHALARKIDSDPTPPSTAVTTCPLKSLPVELLMQIFRDLGAPKGVAALGLASKELHEISRDDVVWKPLFQRRFPDINPDSDLRPNPGYLNLYKDYVISENLRAGKYIEYEFKGHEELEVWDRTTKKFIERLKDSGQLICQPVVVGKRLYAAGAEGEVGIWDTELGTSLATLIGHKCSVIYLGVMGNCLFTHSLDLKVKVWDITTGELLKRIKGKVAKCQVVENCVYMVLGDHRIKVRDYNFPCLASHSLHVLEESLKTLENMAYKEQEQEYEIVNSLAKELHPDFKARFDQLGRKKSLSGSAEAIKSQFGASPPFSRRAILHIEAEVCAEILLHALHGKKWNRVYEILDQFQAIDPIHAAKLFELLADENALKSSWAEQAFYDHHMSRAPLRSKIQAVLKLEKILSSTLIDTRRSLSKSS